MPKIRLWKVGSLEHKTHPTQEQVHLLSQAIQRLDKEGGNLIWGPAIDVVTVEGEVDIIIEELENGNKKITKVEKQEETESD